MIHEFASKHNINTSLLQAIVEVESAGEGFNQDNSLKIRFEAHLALSKHPMLSRWLLLGEPKWLNHFYRFPSFSTLWREIHTGKQESEYNALLTVGLQIGKEAFDFCSMGKFQIMGFHYSRLGFSSSVEMFSFMSQSIEADTSIGLRLIESDTSLLTALQSNDINTFVRLYNGTAQINHYTRLINEKMR